MGKLLYQLTKQEFLQWEFAFSKLFGGLETTKKSAIANNYSMVPILSLIIFALLTWPIISIILSIWMIYHQLCAVMVRILVW